MKPDLPPFFTLDELAERWRLSVKTLRRLIARRDLPAHKMGGQIRVSRDAAVAYERSVLR